MKTDSGLQRALGNLYSRNLHTIRLGLEPVRALLRELDDPQDHFLAVHIAGTNGKGSVSAMIDAILREAGLPVGLYTSPHLVRFNERIAIGGHEIDDKKLAGLIGDIETAVARMRKKTGERDVTFFEFTTALAFEHFRRAGARIAVVETGMGGRLDATNVITPAVSVITSIGIEHTAYLGDTLAKIAAEKAGIIKEGRPVVCGELPDEARDVVARTARKLGATLIRASDSVRVTRKNQSLDGQKISIDTEDDALGTCLLPLLGRHQLGNCALALAAVGVLRRDLGLPISDDAIVGGLQAVRWPGRLEVISNDPPVILDGAHNPEAAAALADTVAELAKKKPVGIVVGCLSDKDAAQIVRPFSSARVSWAVEPGNERAMPAAALAEILRRAGLAPKIASLKVALAQSRAWAKEQGGIVVVFGSLYLCGEVLAMRHESA